MSNKILTSEEAGEIEYTTRVDVNIAILREMERINFREKMRLLMPMLAQQLIDASVDFSRAHFDGPAIVTDEEIDQVFDFWISYDNTGRETAV